MLKIRLQRVGRKHEPSFRLVLTDSKNSTKSGRFGEVLGSYDPRKSAEAFKSDRIKHWLSKGVGVTATVNNLLIRHGLLKGKKIDVSAGSAPISSLNDSQSESSGEQSSTVLAEAPASEPVVESALETSTSPEQAPAEAPTEESKPEDAQA